MTAQSMQIRAALASDSKCLWQWRNDPLTRAMSLNTKAISFVSHQTWFLSVLKNASQQILIGYLPHQRHLSESLNDGLLVGMVRFDLVNSANTDNIDITLSINLNPECRGQGLAKVLLRNAITHFTRYLSVENTPELFLNLPGEATTGEIKRKKSAVFAATIKASNHASINTFLATGFTRLDNLSDCTQGLYKLRIKLP